MHGPPLTPQEAVASVARRVRSLEEHGLDREQAIRRAAAENVIEPEKVRWCVDQAATGASRCSSPDRARDSSACRHDRRQHESTPDRIGTASIARTRRRRSLPALAAVLAACLLALAGPAGAQAATINVSAATGKDTNSGTATAPLKTLTKALSSAKAGDTVKLAGGGYGTTPQGFGNGEQIPPTGLAVPSGVTIEGATSNGSPVATLLGRGSGVGLNLQGSATVRNLSFGGGGFGVGLVARQGSQTLSNLFMTVRAERTGNVDGVPFSAGIVLRGTAQTTLNAGAQQGNSTGTSILLIGGTAVSVNEQARLTMNGGQITGGEPNCRTNTKGIVVGDSAHATMNDVRPIRNIAGSALTLTGDSKATLRRSVVSRANSAGCNPSPSVALNDSAALTTEGTGILGGDANQGVGILTNSAAPLALRDGSNISAFATGIKVEGEGDLTLTGAGVGSCRICIDASFAPGTIAITDSTVQPGRSDIGVGIIAPTLKLRGSRVDTARTGVLVTGPGADLGTVSDPGDNTFDDNGASGVTGVTVPTNVLSSTINAVGNTWNPAVQGADGSGRYPKPIVVTGKSPLARGSNFNVAPLNSNSGVKIVLGPGTAVGTFRLSPRTLTSRAGRPAAWRLAWTHPVDWRRLDRVVLRLESRGKPVGRITLDQETRRIRASGPAVRLLPGRSAFTSGKTGGKRLTARLVLRVAKRYAGRTLVAKLAASDDNGARQGFRRAGRVRVLAR